ncbi:DNA polymerase III subunit gamma/tau [Candidatus Uhrbacteria bacterium]|nr:DNA polymerase III subunit gamma/tau [Candidatus Uhrbacteria bacterium]
MPTLSQKHRPKSFKDITGQTSITETLRKEVATEVLGHAYLFSGPRGVGKTTAARVFAKALNCEKPKAGEPCNECTLCMAANEGRCLDIIELDAATHTGVDTVRESIIEHVRFSPLMGKRKIYILDEVHMFSTSSWNALLKTLEEPPAYAFFILATTEWHKVPATIISRCQRFEFKRIEAERLAERLTWIAGEENWNVEPDVIDLIVSRADGCLRDAETLLGQLGSLGDPSTSSGPQKIDLKIAHLLIPESHLPLAEGLVKLWAARDHQGALQEIQRLFDDGIQILPLFDDLIQVIRGLLTNSSDQFTPHELSEIALLLLERRKDVKAGVDGLFALQLASTTIVFKILGGDKNQDPRHQEPEPTSLPTHQPTSLDLSVIRSKWPALIRAVDEKNHSLPFILKIARPEAVEGDKIVIRFQYPFHRDKIVTDVKHRRIVEECLAQVYGTPCSIEGIVGDPSTSSGQSQERSQDMVSNILNAFGGSIVES